MAGKKTSKQAPAKKTTAIQEKYTKTAILNAIADDTGLSKKQVGAVLDGLSDLKVTPDGRLLAVTAYGFWAVFRIGVVLDGETGEWLALVAAPWLGVLMTLGAAVLLAGRQIVEKAKTKELFSKPLHPYTMGLIRCLPDVDAPKGTRTLHPIDGRVPSPDKHLWCGRAKCPPLHDLRPQPPRRANRPSATRV